MRMQGNQTDSVPQTRPPCHPVGLRPRLISIVFGPLDRFSFCFRFCFSFGFCFCFCHDSPFFSSFFCYNLYSFFPQETSKLRTFEYESLNDASDTHTSGVTKKGSRQFVQHIGHLCGGNNQLLGKHYDSPFFYLINNKPSSLLHTSMT